MSKGLHDGGQHNSETSRYNRALRHAYETLSSCFNEAADVIGRATTDSQRHETTPDLSAAYYQRLHDTNDGYRRNNWLLDDLSQIISAGPHSLLEIGCGNGKFLAKAAERVHEAVGVDWAVSPAIRDLPANARFLKRDVLADPLPNVDLVCSADVLEHFPPERIVDIVSKLLRAGQYQYHIIACYHDRHSHLTVTNPGVWLAMFRIVSTQFRLRDVRFRKENAEQLICVIANY